MMSPMQPPARFELELRLELDMLTTVRRFIESLYERLLDRDIASRVGLTAHELMDNAIRHAAADKVFLCVEITGDTLSVHTQNRAHPRDIATLHQTISDMQSRSDPFQYYLDLMDRTAARTDISGLGLGRIWAEADMVLSCDSHADRVSVFARLPLTGSAA